MLAYVNIPKAITKINSRQMAFVNADFCEFDSSVNV